MITSEVSTGEIKFPKNSNSSSDSHDFISASIGQNHKKRREGSVA